MRLVGSGEDSPAQVSAYSGKQLSQPKWLREVVVGSRLQADDHIHLVLLGSQDDDDALRVPLPKAPTQVNSVNVGQAEV
jgi:hypothetical protein